VFYLQSIFGKNIRAVVPQIAMSAGTILACSCREIVMGKQSSLGPIDPLLRDIPAQGVKEEFKRALKEIRREPNSILVWQHILTQYKPTFLSQCENAIKWSNDFVRQQLRSVMFEGENDAGAKSSQIVEKLSRQGIKGHDRHIHYDEAQTLGLNIVRLEDDQRFQEAVLSAHHACMITLSNSPAFKIIQNQNGSTYIKQMAPPVPQFRVLQPNPSM
jgi:hypothetical protein